MINVKHIQLSIKKLCASTQEFVCWTHYYRSLILSIRKASVRTLFNDKSITLHSAVYNSSANNKKASCTTARGVPPMALSVVHAVQDRVRGVPCPTPLTLYWSWHGSKGRGNPYRNKCRMLTTF